MSSLRGKLLRLPREYLWDADIEATCREQSADPVSISYSYSESRTIIWRCRCCQRLICRCDWSLGAHEGSHFVSWGCATLDRMHASSRCCKRLVCRSDWTPASQKGSRFIPWGCATLIHPILDAAVAVSMYFNTSLQILEESRVDVSE